MTVNKNNYFYHVKRENYYWIFPIFSLQNLFRPKRMNRYFLFLYFSIIWFFFPDTFVSDIDFAESSTYDMAGTSNFHGIAWSCTYIICFNKWNYMHTKRSDSVDGNRVSLSWLANITFHTHSLSVKVFKFVKLLIKLLL